MKACIITLLVIFCGLVYSAELQSGVWLNAQVLTAPSYTTYTFSITTLSRVRIDIEETAGLGTVIVTFGAGNQISSAKQFIVSTYICPLELTTGTNSFRVGFTSGNSGYDVTYNVRVVIEDPLLSIAGHGALQSVDGSTNRNGTGWAVLRVSASDINSGVTVIGRSSSNTNIYYQLNACASDTNNMNTIQATGSYETLFEFGASATPGDYYFTAPAGLTIGACVGSGCTPACAGENVCTVSVRDRNSKCTSQYNAASQCNRVTSGADEVVPLITTVVFATLLSVFLL